MKIAPGVKRGNDREIRVGFQGVRGVWRRVDFWLLMGIIFHPVGAIWLWLYAKLLLVWLFNGQHWFPMVTSETTFKLISILDK